MNKKLILVIFSGVVLLLSSSHHSMVYAVDEMVKEKVVEKIAKAALPRAMLIGATVDSKTSNTLVVTKNGDSYTVNISSVTQLRRLFWAKATLDEIQVGDNVNIHGKWTNETKNTINAVLVRDTSIQKRLGVFVGTVTDLTEVGWTMDTVNRGVQTVTISSTTKFVNRKEGAITRSVVKVGDKVRVRGLWDKASNSVTEVAQVKDYNLPLKETTTASPSGSAQ